MNIRDIHELVLELETFDVPRHPDVDKAIAAYGVLQRTVREDPPLDGRLIDLSPDELLSRFETLIVRANVQQRDAAANKLQAGLTAEATAALIEHVPTILNSLRPTFDSAAQAVAKAVAAGIRPGMTSDSVIDLDKPGAITLWRTLEQHTNVLQQIASLRVKLSESLGIAPGLIRGQAMVGERIDWTACFTHPDTNVTVGYGERNGRDRWLSLSIATGGRLRLNDPDETDRILFGEGDSPGWIVCGGSALVYDDERRALNLYQNDWVPSWVNAEQIDHLIDHGVIMAARPGTTPVGTERLPLGA